LKRHRKKSKPLYLSEESRRGRKEEDNDKE
jgi:hypothetical protein